LDYKNQKVKEISVASILVEKQKEVKKFLNFVKKVKISELFFSFF